jgi:serine phosphatase RsbU (regulator of sigma subunit)
LITVPYLERNCSLPGPETPHRLLAVARAGSPLPSLPTLEVGGALHGVLERVWDQPAIPLSLPFSLNGLPCDLTARISPAFPYYILVDVTPHACLVRELVGSLSRGVWVAALVGCFCAVLTWFGLQRFLEPVGHLQGGITAMQARDFSVRLPEEGRDELALLYRAFNRAMVHLADMELAAAVQARILPQGELRAGPFRLASYHRMTQATGGDFFDYFLLPDGRVLMAMGDVTGHGIGSALVTAMAKTGIGILGPALPDRPEEVLQRLGGLLLELLQRKRAMTCLLGILDPATGFIRLANAGHCFPIVVIPGKTPTMLRAVSYPLGVSKRPKVGTSDFSFGPGVPVGAFLVFYTDGLVEAVNDQGQQVGFDRFMEFVSAAVREAPDAPGPVLYERVRGFTGSVPWADDASVVFLQKQETMEGAASQGPIPREGPPA